MLYQFRYLKREMHARSALNEMEKENSKEERHDSTPGGARETAWGVDIRGFVS
jgi:hypothetical protein